MLLCRHKANQGRGSGPRLNEAIIYVKYVFYVLWNLCLKLLWTGSKLRWVISRGSFFQENVLFLNPEWFEILIFRINSETILFLQLRFSFSPAFSVDSDVMLDDVSFDYCRDGDFPTGSNQLSCDFEKDTCSWNHDYTASLLWKRSKMSFNEVPTAEGECLADC